MVGFITNSDGTKYAGKHVLIDMWECSGDMSEDNILHACTEAANAAGATILFKHSHPFEPAGSSGALILAESHITWHYWPEEQYIAFDIFVCGDCDPILGVEKLKEILCPRRSLLKFEERGKIT